MCGYIYMAKCFRYRQQYVRVIANVGRRATYLGPSISTNGAASVADQAFHCPMGADSEQHGDEGMFTYYVISRRRERGNRSAN